MKFQVTRKETMSRGQLLLRTFFGVIYIAIPHFFLLMFVGLWAGLLSFIAFWAVLFTGEYPKSMFEFQVKLQRWMFRVNASMYNLTDEYPAFGLNGSSDTVTVDIPYPEKLSRGKLLLRAIFGIFYIIIPHFFMLFFRLIASSFVSFLAWWIVLFTGEYPEKMFNFITGTFRWNFRVTAYMSFLTDDYPPFSGKE